VDDYSHGFYRVSREFQHMGFWDSRPGDDPVLVSSFLDLHDQISHSTLTGQTN
jgi:hypothetical protein